jgi:hypothetical protein
VLDAIVVTLAAGRKYSEPAAAFLETLARAGNATLVVTDTPEVFPTGVETVPWQPEAAHIWHSKRHAVRAGLERAHTVYFMDSDHCLRPGARVSKLPALAPGAHARFWRSRLQRLQFPGIGALVDPPIAPWLDCAAVHLGVVDWRSSLWWWGDFLWALVRDEAGCWERFCPTWDRLVAWTEQNTPPHPLILGDGVAMAFAAHACGWSDTIHRSTFEGLTTAFVHQGSGAWRRTLEATRAPG